MDAKSYAVCSMLLNFFFFFRYIFVLLTDKLMDQNINLSANKLLDNNKNQTTTKTVTKKKKNAKIA